MPSRLKNLKVYEGSLVDNPANEKARVVLFKRADAVGKKATKTEDGVEYPAEAYAYVPDPEKPSTWKLRLWEDPQKKETAAQVGRAVAALSPKGFRGNRVEIPAKDLKAVKARVRAAWRRTHPDADEDEMPAAIRKDDGLVARLMRVLGKRLGWSDEEVGKAVDEATTFDEQMAEERLRRVDTEVWEYVGALQDAILATLRDDSADREATMLDSLEQFVAAVKEALPTWLAGETVNKLGSSGADGRVLRPEKTYDGSESISEADRRREGHDVGDIDKEALADDVRRHVEELEKRVTEAEGRAEKAEAELAKGRKDDDEDDVWKGVPPEIRKRVEAAEKRAAEAEEVAKRERDRRVTREFVEKARGYRGLPVEPDEFGPLLKAVSEKAPEEYEKLEEVLRAADEAIASGRLFDEVGRSGPSRGGDAYAKLEAAAAELRKADPELTKEQAIVKAAEQHPELAEAYRKELRAAGR